MSKANGDLAIDVLEGIAGVIYANLIFQSCTIADVRGKISL